MDCMVSTSGGRQSVHKSVINYHAVMQTRFEVSRPQDVSLLALTAISYLPQWRGVVYTLCLITSNFKMCSNYSLILILSTSASSSPTMSFSLSG